MVPRAKVILVVFDGWGVGTGDAGDAIAQASTPVLDDLFARFPHTTVEASGRAVGLPVGQMGNSEVGHTNLGAGRVVRQDLVRIDDAVEDGSLAHVPAFAAACRAARERGGRLHLMGLVSPGGVHSRWDHARALVAAAATHGVEHVHVHAFLDGRDVLPRSAAGFLEAEVVPFLAMQPHAHLATVIGRFYAMDRDRRWERTDRALHALGDGDAPVVDDPVAAVRASYTRDVTDEFIEPLAVGAPSRLDPARDAAIFFNFRPDRARQLTSRLTERGLHLATMTRYQAEFPNPVLFPPERVTRTLPEVLGDHGIGHLHVAETEKYAHVTYFFAGGREDPFPHEERILVPSVSDVPTYDLAPAMSAEAITDRLVDAWSTGTHGFAIINYANPDMVGHTGVLPATVDGIEVVDRCMGRLVDAIEASGGHLVVTADHGNAEKMLEPDGSPNTAHTTNVVPVMVSHSGVRLRSGGVLSDVAPTILELMGLDQPPEMTARSLIEGGR